MSFTFDSMHNIYMRCHKVSTGFHDSRNKPAAHCTPSVTISRRIVTLGVQCAGGLFPLMMFHEFHKASMRFHEGFMMFSQGFNFL